jgi:hypothetical protein
MSASIVCVLSGMSVRIATNCTRKQILSIHLNKRATIETLGMLYSVIKEGSLSESDSFHHAGDFRVRHKEVPQ